MSLPADKTHPPDNKFANQATSRRDNGAPVRFIQVSTGTHIAALLNTDLILFAGPLQQTVVLPADTWPDNIRVSIRQIDNISKNNVDFHLVMELGRMTCCSAGNNTWHIISNDKGYVDLPLYFQTSVIT